MAKDISQIIAIHGAITKKKAARRWVQQMVKDHLRKQEGVGFVAEKKGQVVGFIIGEIKAEGFGLEKSGWLEVVMVHPRQMGTGIGYAMAHKLFDYFRKRGIRDVHTSVLWDAVDMLSFFSPSGLTGQLLLTSLNTSIKNQFTFPLDRSSTVFYIKRTT